jgi:hypothetical protein
VVAGEHDAIRGVEEAEVVVGVAWSVERHPLAPAEGDDLGVVDAAGRRWGAHEATSGHAEDLHLEAALERWPEDLVAAPRHRPSERRRVRRAVAGLVVVERFLFLRVEPRAEAAVGDDLGAVGVAHAAGAPEVVGVRVRDDDGVDVLGLVAGPLEPVDEGPPRLRPGHAGIDDGDAALVLEEVAVHMSEAGQHDRQL